MITLSSDFGWPYPAAMKGAILQRSDARLVDITHDFPRQNVRATAFWLREVLPYFPPAVHLVVVDPGVGTDRAAIAIRAGDHAIVAPDNGVALPVARRLGDVEVFDVRIDDPESATFHGRDVFAPAAAEVHEAGIAAFHEHDLFSPVDDYESISFPEATVRDDGARGEVLVVDGFGNAITNVPGEVLDGREGESVEVNGVFGRVAKSYAHVEVGQRVVTVGSHGNVELSVNQGRGDRSCGVSPGARVRLTW